jgi:hypothetical protein
MRGLSLKSKVKIQKSKGCPELAKDLKSKVKSQKSKACPELATDLKSKVKSQKSKKAVDFHFSPFTFDF